MLVESVAVLIVLALLLVSFLRAKHIGYAVAALPVAILPLVYMAARAVLYFSGDTVFGARPYVAMLFCNVLAVAAACGFIGFVARRIQNKKNRRLYMGVMLAFTLLLGWVYIYNTLLFIIA